MEKYHEKILAKNPYFKQPSNFFFLIMYVFLDKISTNVENTVWKLLLHGYLPTSMT